MRSTFQRLSLLLVVVWGALAASDLSAQVVVTRRGVRYPYRVHWGVYDPYYAVTSRVYAQAALIRAQGDAAVSFAHARNLNAEAYSRELDNWVKEVRARWQREIEGELGRMELNRIHQIKRLEFLNDRKWQNSFTWDRLRNHPELSDASIETGDALNFLLDRLGASALPYEFDPATSRFSTDVIAQLQLDDETLSHVMLQQGSYTFPANQEMQGEDVLWPYLLRWDEFESERRKYEAARKAVVEESEASGQVSVESIQQLQETLGDLTDRFHRSRRVQDWLREHLRFSQFRANDRFLWKLNREIAQLEETGDIRPFQGRGGYDPETDGDHVLSLLCFMNRNGIEFAPPQPGSEFAYHRLFTQMRAIYLTVAEHDESIQPEDLTELAE